MIKAHIGRKVKNPNLMATGSVNDLLNDIALIVNGIHTELNQNDPVTGALFKQGVMNMVNDPASPLWTPMSGHTGFVIKKP